MFKFRLVILILLAFTITGGISAATTQKEIQVQPGGTLVLDLQAGGDVIITCWSKGMVAVTMDTSGPDQENVTVDARLDGSRVVVSSEFIQKKNMQQSDITIEISLPFTFDIELFSMGGGLSVNGLEGRISGKTMGGELTLQNLKGELKLTTMGGDVSLTMSEVDGSLTTMGGRMLLEDVVGDVKAKSMGGEVIQRNVTGRDGSSTGETVKISTMGGDIEVSEAPAGADVHTMGGNITIESVYEFARVKTMGGDILIKAADGQVKATTMGGDVAVTVVGGTGGDVELVSMSGEVHLTVPYGYSMDVDIELDYTKQSSRDYKVVSDFDLSQSESPDWDYDNGSPRKTISATASVNGGANRIKLRTVNGNIYLHQGN